MKAWAERTAGERTGLVVGVAVTVAAAVFGAVQCAGPQPGDQAQAPAAAPAAEPAAEPAAAPAAEPTAEPAAEPAAEEAAAELAAEEPAAEEPAAEPAAAEPAAEEPAAAEPAAEEPAADPEPAAAEPAAAPAQAAPIAPDFDLVRVSRDGSAVIAGSAAPGASVRLLLDGVEIGAVPADAQGSFVALFNLAPSAAPRILTLVAVLPDGTRQPAAGRIAISPTVAPDLPAAAIAAADPAAEPAAQAAAEPAPEPAAEPATESPAALLVTAEGARVLQSAGQMAPGMASNVTVDAITYTPEGAVQLAGRGTGGAVVRLYLDNAQVSDATIDPAGNWSVTLGGIAPGVYTLRADQIGPDGKVTSRFETPFLRETVEALAAAAAAEATAAETAAATAETATAEPAPAPVSVTVQPGFTLWRIARENLGEGILYVQVFEANKNQIRNPDLIYPGQVFAIPQAE